MKINSHALLKRFCEKFKGSYGDDYVVVNWAKECNTLKNKVLATFVLSGYKEDLSLDFIDWCFEKKASNGRRLCPGFLPYLINDFIGERKPEKDNPNFYYDEDGIKRVKENAITK